MSITRKAVRLESGRTRCGVASSTATSGTAETLIRLWTEIGESVAAAGIRKLVILNSHGGQPQIMDIVARDLRVRLSMLVVTLNYWGLGRPAGLFPDAELRQGIHGGSGEPSVMLHLRPDLVREAERRNFVPLSVELERDYTDPHTWPIF
jgi:creatinine amidohydrolase